MSEDHTTNKKGGRCHAATKNKLLGICNFEEKHTSVINTCTRLISSMVGTIGSPVYDLLDTCSESLVL